MENDMKIFSTRDLVLASTLVTLGFEMQGIDYQQEGDKNRPTGYFKFDDTPNMRTAEDDFWNGKLSVEPRKFMSNLHGFKAQVYNVYKSPHVDQARFGEGK